MIWTVESIVASKVRPGMYDVVAVSEDGADELLIRVSEEQRHAFKPRSRFKMAADAKGGASA